MKSRKCDSDVSEYRIYVRRDQSMSPTWLNVLVKMRGRKRSYHLAWNGERWAQNTDLVQLQKRSPAVLAAARRIAHEDYMMRR